MKRSKSKKSSVKKKFDVSVVVKFVFVGVVLGLIGFWIFYNFIYYIDCSSSECFDLHYGNCERVRFVREGNLTFEYFVVGMREEKCAVDVTLLDGELTNQELKRLRKKEMRCFMGVGSLEEPQKDIDVCTGPLKEEMQEIIIEKLHKYIAQNLERINEDL